MLRRAIFLVGFLYGSGKGKKWTWQGGFYCHEKESNYDDSPFLCNEVSLNKEDCSYMLDDTTTPVRACEDLSYHANHNDNLRNASQQRKDTGSQLKRRRMLQFDTQVVDSLVPSDEFSCFLKSNETEISLDEVLPITNQWGLDIPDESAPSYEGVDQQSESWFAECLNDCEENFSLDDIILSEAANIQIDISELCNDLPKCETSLVQKRVTRAPTNVIFKGRKSFIRTPSKLPSSVVKPFAFIKPCGIEGDVTLKDINQRIRTPPPSKSKLNQDDTDAYPTSAFSGKPVVGKTKIRIEGGKGSITIMRTKG